jgi:ABC-2 type transport system ATP-binding protein
VTVSRLGSPRGAPAIGRVAIGIRDAGLTLNDITLRTPTLEDVFMELTGTHMDRGDDEQVR